MKKLSLIRVIFIFFVLITACTSKKKVVSDDFATDAVEAGFDENDLNLEQDLNASADQAVAADSNTNDELNLENELNAASDSSEQLAQSTTPQTLSTDNPDELTLDEPAASQAPSVAETAPSIIEDALPPSIEDAPPPAVADLAPPEPAPSLPSESITETNKVEQVQFKSNDSGGALVINAQRPVEYTTRLNSQTNQVIIEVQNVEVPKHLKRPLITKDMQSSIGSIDIYQKDRSNVARFVVQLRAGSPEPLVQPEGNSLVIVGSPTAMPTSSESPSVAVVNTDTAADSSTDGTEQELSKTGILSTKDLDEYLANNNKFFGKQISIEANDLDVRELLKFISEESGINLIIDNDVRSTVSVKLRKVPWDQALVLILKSSGLSYRRQGSVLRIATMATMLLEDQIAIERKRAKEVTEPMIVKNFSINYADVEGLEKKIQEVLAQDRTARSSQGAPATNSVQEGKVTSDKRTGMLVVTATETSLKQIEAIIKILDVQPQQVMVEARVIEASEEFNKSLGVNWGLNRGLAFNSSPRVSTSIGQPWSDPKPINISPALGYSSPQSRTGSFGSSLWLGKMGVMGDLDVQLRLEETENRLKILSTPRVTVLSNTRATINQTYQIIVGTETVTTNNVSTTSPKFADVGVKLNVVPQISNLGTVKLALDLIRTGAQQESQTTNSRDMKTEVIVRSGQTFVIGGVFQSDFSINKNGIPGLKDIPILGTLFRGSSETRRKTELMMFITPKILAPVVPLVNAAVESELDLTTQ